MDSNKEKTENEVTPVVAPNNTVPASSAIPNTTQPRGAFPPKNDFFKGRSGGGSRGGFGSKPFAKEKPEFDNKIIDIRRVTRVTSGGRRFSFSVAMIIGNGKGSVGFGVGKANDTAAAIEKAMRAAKKTIFKVNLRKNMSITHAVDAKYSSAKVILMPNVSKGNVAGSAIRDILNLAKIKNVTAKIVSGSKNKINIAKAAIKALKKLKK